MIYTCTLNPSIDYLVELEQVELGALNRTERTSYYPGGKGINVSRVLKRLGVDSKALGFVGGFTGSFIRDYLTNEGIEQRFIEHEEPTRINIKLKSNGETEINGSGAFISEEQQQTLYKLVSELTANDYFVLAGSFPPSISPGFYESLAAICQEKGIPFVVDVSGPPLKEVLKYKPFLIKPNQHELGDLVGDTVKSKEDAVRYGKELLAQGPKNVIVSMGGEGAVLLNNEITAFATVPKGEVKNSVGAGDSTVAGFLASFVEDGQHLKAFQYGVSSGTATAFRADLCRKEDVEEIYPQIKVEIL